MRGGLTLLAAGLLLGAPAVSAQNDNGPQSAELAVRIVQGGTWEFRTRDKLPGGAPVCTESWTFRRDGSATVISGQQRVEKTWRAVVDDNGLEWLYTTSISGTAGPDCTGELEDPASFPRAENGLVLLFFNGGNAFTCAPPQRVDGPDGKGVPYFSNEGCWGEITPVGPSGG